VLFAPECLAEITDFQLVQNLCMWLDVTVMVWIAQIKTHSGLPADKRSWLHWATKLAT